MGDSWWTSRHVLYPLSLVPQRAQGVGLWGPLSYLILLQRILVGPHVQKEDFVSKVVSQSLRTTKHYFLISACVAPQTKRASLYSSCMCPMLSPPPSSLSVLWLLFCSPNYRSLEPSMTWLDRHPPVT